MRRAVVLGVVHALVDATTAGVVMRATQLDGVTAAAALIITYDMVAFAVQPFLGWAQDRWTTPRRVMTAGLVASLVAVAVLTVAPTPGTTVAALVAVVAGLGNAAFHLGAGAQILATGLDRSARAGVFVAPGALGLGAGMWFGRHPELGPTAMLAVPLLLTVTALAVLALRRASAAAPVSPQETGVLGDPGTLRGGDRGSGLGGGLGSGSLRSTAVMVLVLLLVSVAIRSLVGLSASRGYSRDTWLLLGLPLAAALGKGLGGFMADRWGWVRTSTTALVISAPLLAVQYSHPLPLLVGLLVFQTTMPVTLVAVARLIPGYPGTAFGLPCLALALGGLPTMTTWGASLCNRSALGCWALVAAAAVWAGLSTGEALWRFRAASCRRPGNQLPGNRPPSAELTSTGGPTSGAMPAAAGGSASSTIG